MSRVRSSWGAGRDGDRSTPHHHLGASDWASFWAASSGWKRDVDLPQADHPSFCDQHVVLPQLAQPLALDLELITTELGTIDPDRSLGIQRGYLLALFDLHLLNLSARVFDLAAAMSPHARLVP